MKQDYTLYIYKRDQRYKAGERLFSTTVWPGQDEAGMRRTVTELYPLYKATDGFRMEFHPVMKTVRNLMSGVEIQIPHDTPRSCDPSSELYWSM
jgi:hypothetical protein